MSSSNYSTPRAVDLVDLGFMDARSKLIDVAAFLDRVQRAGQEDDYRVQALKQAVVHLSRTELGRTKEVLLTFSDPSVEPIAKAEVQGAAGAWKGE